MTFWLFGARIRLSFWLLALVAGSIYLGGAGAAAILFAVAVHELGHLAAVLLTGGYVTELELGCFGARMKTGYPTVVGAWKDFLVLLAGPGAGLFLSALCLSLGFFHAGLVNLALSFFNLLPVSGLDGGSALRILLTAVFGGWGERIYRVLSLGFLCALIVAGFLFCLSSRPNPSFLILGAYLILCAVLRE